jgi:hypothetical protein
MALTMDLKPRLSATMASLSSSVTSERPKTTSVMEHANNHGGSPLIRQSRHDMRVEYLMLRHEQLELCRYIQSRNRYCCRTKTIWSHSKVFKEVVVGPNMLLARQRGRCLHSSSLLFGGVVRYTAVCVIGSDIGLFLIGIRCILRSSRARCLR